MASSGKLLACSDVHVTLGASRILREISLEIGPGECVGLIGPNGSGKTTLLRVFNGIIPATTGEVLLKGKPLTAYPPKRRAQEIAFMMQHEWEAITFPVLDVLLTGRYPYKRSLEAETDSDEDRAREALAFVGLSGYEERDFTTLSAGEKQLVLFARTLVQETDIVLLDEPTSNLDIKHQEQIFSRVQDLADQGKTLVIAVHNLNEASRYCSRLVLLDHGRVAGDGEPDTIMASGLIGRVYDVSTVTQPDPLSGSPQVHILPRQGRRSACRVHVIGGAGSGLMLSRRLYEAGCTVTGGVVSAADPDAALWELLDIPHVTGPDFAPVDPDKVAAAVELAAEADMVVFTAPGVGTVNAANLELLRNAPHAAVLPAARDAREWCEAEGVPFEVLSVENVVDHVRRPVPSPQ
jgi:iron complex transport system ATP-binding protein